MAPWSPSLDAGAHPVVACYDSSHTVGLTRTVSIMIRIRLAVTVRIRDGAWVRGLESDRVWIALGAKRCVHSWQWMNS